MEKFFKLSERGTTVKIEMTAGITTFFAMVYILMVNANMLPIRLETALTYWVYLTVLST